MEKKKHRFLKALATLFMMVLLANWAGPNLLLRASIQPEPAEEYAYSEAFETTYEDVRAQLNERVAALKADGVAVQTYSHPIDEAEGLYIDNVYLPSTGAQTNLIVLTTGVHGIEGYIGAVMLEVFFSDIYPQLDTADTGVLVVANVNPYGMKNMRRYNENNVDLNRNFILDWENFDLTTNDKYPQVESFLGPQKPIRHALWHELGFYLHLGKEAVTVGADTVSDALLGGQYEYPQGVYYGGNGDEASTVYLKDVFSQCLDGSYENIVHIDIHSGYGPRYNMVIFNSVYETMTEAESQAAFGYEHIIAHDSEAFYATTGDTTDFFYRLAEQEQTDKDLFSTCFEFGTIGDSFMNSITSLKYTVDENRQYWYPTDNEVTAEIVRQRYLELFYPTETQWREKAVEDFTTATQGVLEAKLK